MSAPSEAHESRRRDLELLAALAGIRSAASLGPRLEPDVLKVDTHRGILFIGDAKETETPHCWSTRQRLLGYAVACRPLALVGANVAFAVAHARPHSSREWSKLLVDVVEQAGLVPLSASSCTLDSGTAVTIVAARATKLASVRPAKLWSAAWPDFPPTAVVPCAPSTSSAARAA